MSKNKQILKKCLKLRSILPLEVLYEGIFLLHIGNANVKIPCMQNAVNKIIIGSKLYRMPFMKINTYGEFLLFA